MRIYSYSVINSQFVSFLVADGLESVDQVSDDLHPAVLRLLVLRHQVKLSDIRCWLEDDGEGRVFCDIFNLTSARENKILFKTRTKKNIYMNKNIYKQNKD